MHSPLEKNKQTNKQKKKQEKKKQWVFLQLCPWLSGCSSSPHARSTFLTVCYLRATAATRLHSALVDVRSLKYQSARTQVCEWRVCTQQIYEPMPTALRANVEQTVVKTQEVNQAKRYCSDQALSTMSPVPLAESQLQVPRISSVSLTTVTTRVQPQPGR